MKWINKKIFFLMFFLGLSGCDKSDSIVLSGYSYGDFIYLSHYSTEKVEKLFVDKGEIVIKGQHLVKMEGFTTENARRIANENYQAESALLRNMQTGERREELDIVRSQLERAKAAARLAKSQMSRNQQLYASHVISESEWDNMKEDYAQKVAQVDELSNQIKAKSLPARQDQIANQISRVESARLQLDKANWDFERNIIDAPQGGIIYDIIYRAGERPVAGRPIISLLPPDNIKVRFFIPETLLGKVHVGNKVKFSCDGCKDPITGTINYISPQAEYTPPVIYSTKRREKLLFMAEALPSIEQASLIKIGQPITVELIPDE